MRKSKVFDGSEPRLALYSSLITHFRNFRKILKINAKMAHRIHEFWFTNQLLADFWHLFVDFLVFLSGVEDRELFWDGF